MILINHSSKSACSASNPIRQSRHSNTLPEDQLTLITHRVLHPFVRLKLNLLHPNLLQLLSTPFPPRVTNNLIVRSMSPKDRKRLGLLRDEVSSGLAPAQEAREGHYSREFTLGSNSGEDGDDSTWIRLKEGVSYPFVPCWRTGLGLDFQRTLGEPAHDDPVRWNTRFDFFGEVGVDSLD